MRLSMARTPVVGLQRYIIELRSYLGIYNIKPMWLENKSLNILGDLLWDKVNYTKAANKANFCINLQLTITNPSFKQSKVNCTQLYQDGCNLFIWQGGFLFTSLMI